MLACAVVTRRALFFIGVLSLCSFLTFFPQLSYSAEQSPSPPRSVDVGIYLKNVPSVSLKEKKFQADFYIWFRWTGDDIDPLESFELVNGHIDSKDWVVKKKIGNVNYGSCRIEATFYRNYDVSKYPLDNQTLKIQIEDSKTRSNGLVYHPDKASTGISSKISVPGWGTGKFDSYSSVTTYPTNVGDISQPNNEESNFPRYTFALELKRVGNATFIKLFSMLFLAGGLAFCTFGVRPDHLGERFSLNIAGVFLAATTQTTLATILPESDSFGMGDKLYNLTMVFIFFSFLSSIYTFKIFHRGEEEKAGRISHKLGIYLAIAYVLLNVVVVASTLY